MCARQLGSAEGMAEPQSTEIVDDQLGESAPGIEQAAETTDQEPVPASPTPQPRETVEPGV
jgi:hypothetical protein